MKKVLASLLFLLMAFSVSFAAESQLEDGSFIKKLNVSGSLRTRYSAYESSTTVDTMGISRARIKITGELAPDFSFLVQPDFAGLSTGGTVAFADAYIEFKNLCAHVKSLKIGQFLLPFAYDSGKYKTIYGTGLNPSHYGVIMPARDYGLRVAGVAPILSNIYFDAAVVNGTGSVDTNKSKDIVARVNFKNDMLDLGLSSYSGKAGATQTAKEDIAVDLEIKGGPSLLVAEYVIGQNTAATAKLTEASLQLSYLLKNYEPLVKLEIYDPSVSTSSDGVNTATLGLNYVFDSNRKLLVNYNIPMEETTQINNNSLLIELQTQI